MVIAGPLQISVSRKCIELRSGLSDNVGNYVFRGCVLQEGNLTIPREIMVLWWFAVHRIVAVDNVSIKKSSSPVIELCCDFVVT